MASREFLTDEAVEDEINRLRESEFVKLAKKEEHIRNKRRQYMYCLRGYEKRGKQLASEGVTMESLQMLETDTEDIK